MAAAGAGFANAKSLVSPANIGAGTKRQQGALW